MKVLQVNVVYRKGSTGKIVYDIHELLVRQGVHSVVCYGRGAETTDDNVNKTCNEIYAKANKLFSKITGYMYGGCGISTKKLISIIEREQPDIVHLHCLNGNFVNIYKLISWLKGKQIHTVLTLHAEFMYTGNCGHALDCEKWKKGCGDCPRLKMETGSLFFDRTNESWHKMKYAFDEFGDTLVIVSVSPWLMERAMRSPILENCKHRTILNGIDSKVFFSHPREEVETLKKKLDIQTEHIVFHATANFNSNPNHLKGGYYVIELAKRMPDTTFVVAGQKNTEFEVPSNMILLGAVSDQNELAILYSMADATIITSRRETFSMIVAESLCCGTPIVGFMAGGPESIALNEYSVFVNYGDIPSLQKSLFDIFSNIYDREVIEKEANTMYSKERMIKDYYTIYNEMINN